MTLSTKEAAIYLGVKPTTIQDYAERRMITHYKIGNRLRFEQKDLDAFLKSRRVEGRPVWPRLRKVARQ